MFKKSLSIALAIALGLSMSHVEVFADVEGLVSSVEQNEVVPPEEGQSPDVGGGTEQGEEALTPTPAEQFEFNKDTGTIDKYIGNDNEVIVIPEKIDGVTVTSIAKEAFYNKGTKDTTIKKVVFNEGLVSIGENAFKDCKALSEIKLSSTIRNLGKKMFSGTAITEVVLNEGLENIGESAFNGCKTLTNVQFSSTIKEIGKSAFSGTNIKNLVLNEGLDVIGQGSFSRCKNLETIKLSSTVKEIGDMAFAMANISSIDLNSNLEVIGTKAFMNCKNLASKIEFKGNLKEVGMSAFNLTGVKEISILEGNNKLEISEGVFIAGINKLSVPQKRAIMFSSQAFVENKSDSDEKIILDLGELNLESRNKKEVEEILNKNIKLTSGFKDDKKFLENEGIEWKNLDEIEKTNLEKINIEGTFKSIPDEKYTQSGLSKEKNDIEKTMSNYLIKVTLNLKKSDIKWTSKDFTSGECAYTATDGQYFGITGLTDSGKEKLEKTKTIAIPKYVENTDGSKKLVEGIGKEAFKNMGIEGITFPSDLDGKKDFVIDAGAFSGNNISSLSIPNYVKFIDSEAFKGNKITSLYIPASVLRIGNASFQGNEISKLEFSDDVELIQIDNYSFSGNKIKEVHLPYSIFKLLGEVFKDQKNRDEIDDRKVSLYTRNPKHLTEETYIQTKSEYHKFILKGENVNREELYKEIKEANKLNPSEYNSEKWNVFENVLNNAKAVFEKEDSTQAQINEQLNKLSDALAVLTDGVNKTDLRKLISSIGDLKETLYTSESWKNLMDEKAKAQSTLDKSKDQKEIDAAKNSLQKAIDELKIKDEMKYNVDDFTFNGTVITGYSEKGKEKFKTNKYLVIPEKNDKGQNITEIGKQAFETTDGVIMGTDTVKSPNGLLSVSIPDSVTKIDEGAFRFNRIKTIKLPSKLREIGLQAFNGNTLISVSIPDSVIKVGAGAFSVNTDMTSIKLSNSMKTVPEGICARNTSLTSVTIPNGVEVIGQSAFVGTVLKQIKIPNTVKEIQYLAFASTRLESIEIPGSVKTIGEQAFANNKKWRTTKKLVLHEGVETIGENAFKECLLKEVNLPYSLKSLHPTAFQKSNDYVDMITKLYTSNSNHLNFEKDGDTYEIIYKAPSEPSVPSIPSTPEKPQEEEKPDEGVKVEVVDKIAGENRYDTSVDISQKVYSSSQKVYLVSGEKFPDALSSAALAGKGDGPILLINDNNIDKILAEINRLGAKEIVFVGGNSISKANKDKIKKFAESKSSVVSAFAGENRYETAIKVAEETIAKRGNKGKVIIADGRNYPDAVSIASFSSKEGIPVILVNGNNIPKEVKAFLNKYKIKDAIVVGGTKAVGSDIEKLFTKVERVAGEDRYDTSKKIAERFFANSKTIFVASGESFADSLSVSYYAGKEHSPILLTKANSLDNDTRDYLNANKDKNYIIIGGDKAVNPNLFN